MFDRFRDEAQRAMREARTQAGLWGHEVIGTEHLLAGIARADTAARAVLAGLEVSAESILAALEQRVEVAPADTPAVLPFTPRAKVALEQAMKQARRSFGHEWIGTEHVLLGLAHDAQGTAGATLAGLGLDVDRVRDAIVAWWATPEGAVREDASVYTGRHARRRAERLLDALQNLSGDDRRALAAWIAKDAWQVSDGEREALLERLGRLLP